jgi:hypothetical protein
MIPFGSLPHARRVGEGVWLGEVLDLRNTTYGEIHQQSIIVNTSPPPYEGEGTNRSSKNRAFACNRKNFLKASDLLRHNLACRQTHDSIGLGG